MTVRTTAALRLEPPMVAEGAPVWDGATWIGQVEKSAVSRLDRRQRVQLADAEGYHRARILVRDEGRPLGYVEVDVVDRPRLGPSFEVGALLRGLATLPVPPAPAPAPFTTPRITVVISTRDRAEMLRTSLDAVLAVDYEDFEVIVVDNAPSTSATRDVVAECTDSRVRYLLEPAAGLSQARNTGLLAATGSIVAYVDDDVVMDSRYLRALADSYAREPEVICIGGLVPPGELRTPTQMYFDERVTWARVLRPRVFRLHEAQPDLPLFPFALGAYGTGANMSVRRDAALALGGFDAALGVGTKTGGGEDSDMYLRALYSGAAMAVEPSAIVWHRHRSDEAALHKQSVGYGIGLGAMATKILTQPRMAFGVLRRLPRAIAKLSSLGESDVDADAGVAYGIPADVTSTPRSAGIDAKGFRGVELAAVLRGPFRFFAERFAGKNLLERSSAGRREALRVVGEHPDLHGFPRDSVLAKGPRPVVDGRMTPGSRIAAAALAVLLLAAGVVGGAVGALVFPAVFSCIGLVVAAVLVFPSMRATWFVSYAVAASLTIGIGLGWATSILAAAIPFGLIVASTSVGVVLAAWSIARDTIALRAEHTSERPARVLAADTTR
jgi:GT2 family glycosyltransferase